MTFLSAVILIFLVMDPLGNIPVFTSILSCIEKDRKKRIVIRELIIALAVLLLFLFTGPAILKMMRISEPSLTIAGGIILFLIALRMIFPFLKSGSDEELKGEPFIVPLAIPFIAGPSAMATVMLITSREPGRLLEWTAALVTAWLLSGGILVFSSNIGDMLGKRGIVAIERLMGMILTAISIEMILNGIHKFIEIN